jgi:hypothetical protein
MSDLHLEFETTTNPPPAWRAWVAERRTIPGHPSRGPSMAGIVGVDLVVMAGDIDTGVWGIHYADEVACYVGAPVVYVFGNHECYGHDIAELLPELRQAAWATDGRVVFLERNSARLWLNGERLCVLGCTLWTDYALNGDCDAAMRVAIDGMNDYARISRNGRVFTPADALAIHRTSRDWLGEKVRMARATDPAERLLIVTHHAPAAAGLGSRPDWLAPAYASDLTAEIRSWRPDAWLHGHTHHGHVTDVAGTILASAPRGYLGVDSRAISFVPAVLEL